MDRNDRYPEEENRNVQNGAQQEPESEPIEEPVQDAREETVEREADASQTTEETAQTYVREDLNSAQGYAASYYDGASRPNETSRPNPSYYQPRTALSSTPRPSGPIVQPPQSGSGPAYGGNGGTPPNGTRPPRKRNTAALVLGFVAVFLAGVLLTGGIAALFLSRNMTGTQNGGVLTTIPDQTQPEKEGVQATMTPIAQEPEATTQPLPTQEATEPAPTSQVAMTDGEEKSRQQIAADVGPAVVGIMNYANVTSYGGAYGGSYGGFSFGGYGNQTPTTTEQLSGSGSGIIVTTDGYVVTNYHVVEGASRLTVLYQGEEIDAKLIGSDETHDLAVLKIDRSGLSAASFADSSKVQVGDEVLAIGNPLGTKLVGTVTQGIISAVDRNLVSDGVTLNLLQTDAAINPGNSGGALVNTQGLIIGINTLKTYMAGYDAYGNTVSSEGIGFALPSNVVKPIIDTIISTGKSIPRPGIGVTIGYLTEQQAQYYNLNPGLVVGNVISGSPAEAAGLQYGDVIQKVDDVEISSSSDFTDYISSCSVGQSIVLTVLRGNQNYRVELQVSDMNEMDYSNSSN